jgi:hypothetical protein
MNDNQRALTFMYQKTQEIMADAKTHMSLAAAYQNLMSALEEKKSENTALNEDNSPGPAPLFDTQE